MGYAANNNKIINFPAVNFGTTTTRYFRLPKGMRGRIEDIEARVTTLFTAVTTPAHIKVGISGQLTAFADFDAFGVSAAGVVLRATKDDPTAIVDTEMPMDTLYFVTMEAPTGGSPAGVADVMIELNAY